MPDLSGGHLVARTLKQAGVDTIVEYDASSSPSPT